MQDPSMDEYPRGFEPEGRSRYSVLEEAKKSVERQAAGWTDHTGDVFAEVVYRAADGGLGVIGLAVDMNSDVEKEYVALMMFATLAMERATECSFISSAWSIGPESAAAYEAAGRPGLANFPGRKEVANVMYMGPDGESMHSIEIFREDGSGKPPTLGTWQDEFGRPGQPFKLGGRFPDAAKRGIKAGKMLPPEMIEYIEKEKAAGNGEMVLKAFMKARQIATDPKAARELHQEEHPSMVSGCGMCEARSAAIRKGEDWLL